MVIEGEHGQVPQSGWVWGLKLIVAGVVRSRTDLNTNLANLKTNKKLKVIGHRLTPLPIHTGARLGDERSPFPFRCFEAKVQQDDKNQGRNDGDRLDALVFLPLGWGHGGPF